MAKYKHEVQTWASAESFSEAKLEDNNKILQFKIFFILIPTSLNKRKGQTN